MSVQMNRRHFMKASALLPFGGAVAGPLYAKVGRPLKCVKGQEMLTYRITNIRPTVEFDHDTMIEVIQYCMAQNKVDRFHLGKT